MPMSMQEFEKRSGVAQDHVEALRRVCAERKVFLFLRPTDPASTRLIKEGYATKSMDIHHKSSNWGPMAGMVPVDPAFNKVFGVTQQNPNPAEPLPQPLAHAHNLGLHLTRVQTPAKDEGEMNTWVLLSPDADFSRGETFLAEGSRVMRLAYDIPPPTRWTDDLSSLLPVIRTSDEPDRSGIRVEPAEKSAAVAAPAGP